MDLDTMSDPLQRSATVSIINNFGQTPKQLFKRPHPPKRIATRFDPMAVISRRNTPERLLTTGTPVREIDLPVGDLVVVPSNDKIAVAGLGQLLVPPA